MPKSLRITTLVLTVVTLVAFLAAPALARPGWKKRIDRLVGGRSMSVVVRDQGRQLYNHNGGTRRAPASNEKLLLSMALLDRIEPTHQIATTVGASAPVLKGVLDGDLWLLGRGDPSITAGARFGRELPFSPTRISAIAKAVTATGLRRVNGSVAGSTGYYARDWWAPGWKPNFPADEIPLPTALSFEGNVRKGKHIADPELRAARALTKRLGAEGVAVTGSALAGQPPANLADVTSVRSVELRKMMGFMNRRSSNWFAEMFVKRLAVEAAGAPGTIARGAQAIEAWADRHGVDIDAYDGSGLSYSNRASAAGIARLISAAERESWGGALRKTLAGAGEGTLKDRLGGVRLKAKTGTLDLISTLSGWVWLRQTKSWAEFSIMSNGMYKSTAAPIEDAIVRELTRSAR
jgi:D-alanyl-D-alanine carboxypeptidase